MKKILFFLFLIGAISFAEKETVDNVSTVVSNVFSTGKDVFEGIKKGINLDGAYLIEDAQELEKNVEVKILKISYIPNQGNYRVTVGFKNKTENLIRIINLYKKENFYGLDRDNYAIIPEGTIEDITIFKDSQVKKEYIFKDKINKLKIFEKEYKKNFFN